MAKAAKTVVKTGGGKAAKSVTKFPPKKPGMRDVDPKRKAPPFGKKGK